MGTALVVLLALALGWALSAGPLPLLRLLVVLLAGQGFLHLVLTFASGHAHGPATVSTSSMIGGHAVAAMIAAVLVRHADLLIDRWGALLAAVIGAEPPRTCVPRAALTTVVPDDARTPGRLLRLEHRVHRRGPPALGAPLTA